jgi:Transcriptional regulator PadR-like family
MRRKVPVNGRVRMVVIALVHMLRRKHGARAHDASQQQNSCYSDRPKHRRDYGLGCLDGQTASHHPLSRGKSPWWTRMEYDREFLTGTVGVLILSLLKQPEMYGYELLREAERRNSSAFQLKEGTLYPTLHHTT